MENRREGWGEGGDWKRATRAVLTAAVGNTQHTAGLFLKGPVAAPATLQTLLHGPAEWAESVHTSGHVTTW